MSNDNTPNKEMIKQFFEKKVNESGHTFESIITKSLRKEEWVVRQQEIYLDKDEEIGRAIDLIAIDHFPRFDDKSDFSKRVVEGQVRLITECKKLPDHAWIFFDEGETIEAGPEFVTMCKEVKHVIYPYIPNEKIPDIYFSASFAEFMYDDGQSNKNQKSNKKINNLYEAILAVTKATRHQIEFIKSLNDSTLEIGLVGIGLDFGFHFFQPLIIFQGNMYKAIENHGEVKLESINEVQIRKSYLSGKYKEEKGLIHIITPDALPSYISKIRNYFWKNNWVTNQQGLLIDAVDYFLKNRRSQETAKKS